MLKDSLGARIFIRASILGLRIITPLSIGYCIARLLGWKSAFLAKAVMVVDIYAGSESLFYLMVYLPRQWWLNRAAPQCLPLRTRTLRRQAFDRTWGATPDPHGYVSLWFKGAAVEDLRQEDLKDWLYWRLWNSTKRVAEDEAELEEYYVDTQRILGIEFAENRSGIEPMMVTLEPLHMKHRPLFWYLFLVGSVDTQLCATMAFNGYQFHGLSLTQFFNSLPLRPAALLSPYRSPVKHFSYWHLEHSSPDRFPVLFIHGIGIGLQFYLNFFHEFREINQRLGVGMIALEVLPVSSRIAHPILKPDQTAQEIHAILRQHGWSRCVLMTHSYGSVIAAHLLRNPDTAPLIEALLFADPVTFSFHPPQVAWNFLRRKPRTASEIQLEYFASTDAGVAHALTRSFVWVENSLWREELQGKEREQHAKERRCTVALCGRDIITDTNTLGRYLTRPVVAGVRWHEETDPMDDTWKSRRWTGDEPIEVIWSPELNHAEVFDEEKDRRKLFKVLEKYSRVSVVGVRPLVEGESHESGLLYQSNGRVSYSDNPLS